MSLLRALCGTTRQRELPRPQSVPCQAVARPARAAPFHAHPLISAQAPHATAMRHSCRTSLRFLSRAAIAWPDRSDSNRLPVSLMSV